MRELFRLLRDIWAQLVDANILKAIKLSHDTTLSDKERQWVQEIADLPFDEEEEESSS
jgi:predicted outer membrane protein